MDAVKGGFTEDHDLFVDAVGVLKDTLVSLGRKAEAAPYYDRSVRLAELRYGMDTPKVAEALQAAGDIWLEVGEGRRAVASLERAAALRKKVRAAPSQGTPFFFCVWAGSARRVRQGPPGPFTFLSPASFLSCTASGTC